MRPADKDSIERQRAPVLHVVDRRLAHDASWVFLCGLLILLQSLLVVTHRPWLDEYQALQIALQSPDLSALLDNLRYEGHPPLWYFLLQIASVAVPAEWLLVGVQWPIALTIQLLILSRPPVSRLERLLFAASFFVLFEYGVLSRSLSLGVLLTLVAFLYAKRPIGWIALALLPSVDFLFGVLSLGLLVLAWRERRLAWPGVALWLVIGLASAWSVRPPSDSVPAFILEGPIIDGLNQLMRLGALLVPIHMKGSAFIWNYPPPQLVALPAGWLFLYLGFRLLRGDRLALSLFFGLVSITSLFSILVYPLAIRHLSLCALTLVLLVWRRRSQALPRSPLFLAWLAVSAICGLFTAGLNLIKPFDTAREAALYIRAHGLADRHWVSFPESRGQGVAALLGIQTERPERDCLQSFVRWNYRSKIDTGAQLDAELHRIAERSGRFYLLTDFPLPREEMARSGDYRLLTHIGRGYVGQHFFLYQVLSDMPERRIALPQCAPSLPPAAMLKPS
mgnify:CR=1 FL=1